MSQIITATGNGINIGVLESKIYTESGYGIVNRDYFLNENTSNEIDVFGSRVFWHPLYEYYEEQGYYLPATHSTDVAHILSGYNGIANQSIIYSIDFRDSLDIYSTVGFEQTSSSINSISEYFMNVAPANATPKRVNIINISAGSALNETATVFFKNLYNRYVYSNNVIIIASSGNEPSSMITTPSSAHNVFSIGGSNNDGDDYYSQTSYLNSYNNIQKPNMIAPAEIDLSTSTSCDGYYIDGTSYATPLVSGATALLLEKRPSLTLKPSEVFALLTASASNRNFQEDIGNTYDYSIAEKSGAGILDVGVLMRNAENTTSVKFYSTDSSKSHYVTNINPNNYYYKLKVAAFWMAKFEGNTQHLNDYKLEIYFNGVLVGYSDIVGNNTELVIANISGNGDLQIKITRNGEHQGDFEDNIGVSWVLTNE